MFYTGSKKILVIEAQSCGCDAYDSPCGCSPTIVTRELSTATELANELRDADMYAMMADLIKNNETFQRALKDAGWANWEKIKTQKEKISFSEKFYLLEGMSKTSYSYLRRVSEVDLDELTAHDAKVLANKDDAALVQKISTASLKSINAKAYKAYLAEAKKKKAASERAKKAAEARKQKKLEKELEKARKLLAEAAAEGCPKCGGPGGINWDGHHIDCPKVQ